MNVRIILLLAFTLAACGHEVPPPAKAPRAVRAVTVESGPAEAPIVASGLLATRDEARLAFKTGGVVRDIAVRAGDSVRRGQVLAEIETTEVGAGVAQARAAYEKAQRDLRRGRALYADDVITREQLDDLGTAEAVARAQFDAAQYNLGHAQIVAPADGVVLRRYVEPRETVAAGQPVLEVAQSGSGHVLKLGLADRDAVRVQLGDAAQIEFDAYPGRRFAARVIELSRAADPRSGAFPVELGLEAQADGDTPLPSGLVGRATISVRGSGATRSYVPMAALVEGDQRATTIFTLDGTTAHARKVAVAFLAGERAALEQALPAGTRVVTDGAAYLSDGEAVRVVEPN
ncbi:efflux RND transporter periplasmic adaptor subunit [Solimonas soli]|uniref:efflux RND transporter periplasmic adaptor subunit n=1 Tax=Solimonas soli TaxID=413479 RepID=UPI000486A795|nr:efflux RND transporter periplasmic adaptor subunit [Solimonas soli]